VPVLPRRWWLAVRFEWDAGRTAAPGLEPGIDALVAVAVAACVFEVAVVAGAPEATLAVEVCCGADDCAGVWLCGACPAGMEDAAGLEDAGAPPPA
jgi:hypothetical protein